MQIESDGLFLDLAVGDVLMDAVGREACRGGGLLKMRSGSLSRSVSRRSWQLVPILRVSDCRCFCHDPQCLVQTQKVSGGGAASFNGRPVPHA